MLGGRPDADFMRGLLDYMVADRSDYIPRLTLGPNSQWKYSLFSNGAQRPPQ